MDLHVYFTITSRVIAIKPHETKTNLLASNLLITNSMFRGKSFVLCFAQRINLWHLPEINDLALSKNILITSSQFLKNIILRKKVLHLKYIIQKFKKLNN